MAWAHGLENLEIAAVPRNADVKGFQVLPRRWVVEPSFVWLSRYKRLARAYERKTAHAEAAIQVAMIRLMAARLAGEHVEPHGPIETEAAAASTKISPTTDRRGSDHPLSRPERLPLTRST